MVFTWIFYLSESLDQVMECVFVLSVEQEQLKM